MAGNTLMSLLVKLGVDSAGFEQAMTSSEKKAGKLTKGLDSLMRKLMLIAGPLAMGKFALNAVKLAARVETLGIVVEKLGDNAGYSRMELDRFEDSIRSQGITTKNTRQAMAQMMQTQVDLAEGADLARLAQDTAVIANINSSEAFTRLITVLQTGNVRMGRTMGLNLQFGKAQEVLAKSLGKTTAELTEQELIQSRLNEVKKAGVAIENTYEAAMGTSGKMMLSMSRLTEELSLLFGEELLPAFGGFVEKLYNTTKGVLEFNRAINAIEDSTQYTVKDFLLFEYVVDETGRTVARTEDEINALGERLQESTDFTRESIVAWQEYMEGQEEIAAASEFVGSKFEVSYIAMRNASDAARNYAGGLDAITKAAEDAGQSVDTNLAGSIEQFIEDQEWIAAGGGELLAVLETLETAEGLTALEKVAFAEELLADAEAWETNLKDSENIIGKIDTKLGELPSQIDILINIRTTGEESRFQHGGSMTVPPGFPNDSYPIFVSSGEHVQVTPSGGSSYDQSDNRTTNIGPVNIGSGDDEWAFLDKLKRITARS